MLSSIMVPGVVRSLKAIYTPSLDQAPLRCAPAALRLPSRSLSNNRRSRKVTPRVRVGENVSRYRPMESTPRTCRTSLNSPGTDFSPSCQHGGVSRTTGTMKIINLEFES
jgi:hypothetical protein